MIEVCIDSLKSAHNAIKGGANELELCSSLLEGGLTPSPGLVVEIMKLVKNDDSAISKVKTTCVTETLRLLPVRKAYFTEKSRQETQQLLFFLKKKKPKVNVMIRCRGGSDFYYSDQEMDTMLADIEVYKSFGVDRFVFGALTDKQEIDKTNCRRIIDEAHPLPVTFHRAFDLCMHPKKTIEDVIALGFTRLLTSGQQNSADNVKAIELLTFLFQNYSKQIEIMPGAGINCANAHKFIDIGFKIIHSSCKRTRLLPEVGNLCMGSNVIYVTDELIVKEMKKIMKSN